MFSIIARYDKPQSSTWKLINDLHRERFPNVLSLIDLALTLPASSAEAERGFSLMKVIKTDWRSCLGDTTLSQLMRVKLEAAPIPEFDPLPAIKHFVTIKDRRKVPDKHVPVVAREDVENEPPAPQPAEPQPPAAQAVVAAAATSDDPDLVVDLEDECYYSDDDLAEPADDLKQEEERAFAMFNSYEVVSGADDSNMPEDFSDEDFD